MIIWYNCELILVYVYFIDQLFDDNNVCVIFVMEFGFFVLGSYNEFVEKN